MTLIDRIRNLWKKERFTSNPSTIQEKVDLFLSEDRDLGSSFPKYADRVNVFEPYFLNAYRSSTEIIKSSNEIGYNRFEKDSLDYNVDYAHRTGDYYGALTNMAYEGASYISRKMSQLPFIGRIFGSMHEHLSSRIQNRYINQAEWEIVYRAKDSFLKNHKHIDMVKLGDVFVPGFSVKYA